MTMSEAGEVASDMSEESEQAFYRRVDALYSVYEDWTGQTDDVEDKPATERRQSNGSDCITPVAAFTTFAVFTARLAVDFGMSREDFLEGLGSLYDNEEEGESADDEAEEGDEPRDEPS